MKSYVVREDALPEAIIKTVQAKEMLARGEALTVNEAVEKIGLSRSAFYKYRDGVQSYIREERDKVITLTFVLEHRAGVLSDVLNTVAALKGNIISINQGTPVHGVAVATMNVNIFLIKDLPGLLERLQAQDGVKRVEIISQV